MSTRFDPTRPIYLQIMETIKKGAVRGRFPPGGRLPSVRDLAQEMAVNPNTMARVYAELEREGFITTHRGGGSFVTEDAARLEAERRRLSATARQRFVAEIRELGLDCAQVSHLLQEVEKEIGDA
ncbi:MAG: GntR family transcriptional regulator [Candidatus Latescibacterota bacterium]